jgi:hypothetical protein
MEHFGYSGRNEMELTILFKIIIKYYFKFFFKITITVEHTGAHLLGCGILRDLGLVVEAGTLLCKSLVSLLLWAFGLVQLPPDRIY